MVMRRVLLMLACAVVLPAQQGHLSVQEQFQQLYTIYDHAVQSGNPVPFFARVISPDYALIAADGTRKDGRQMLDELTKNLRSLPADAEVHLHTVIQRIVPNADGSVDVLGSSHLEITAGSPKGSINGMVRDIQFDHTWIHTPRGFRLRVERVVSEKQKSRTIPG